MPSPCRPRCGPLLRRLALVLCVACAPAAADDAADIRTLLARGELASALARAEQASAARPRDAELQFLLGVVLMDLKRDADALARFERMSQDYPELPDPWNNIALLQVRGGRLDEARQSLENALRNDPTHRTARANLGLVHLMLARQAWEQLAASGPVDALLARRLEAVRQLLAPAVR